MRDSALQPEPAAILAAVAGEASALERYLAGLSEEDLARPSACAGWTNADVVAHLTWASGYFADLLERALQGDTSPPPDLPPPSPARRQRIAELAQAARTELGGSLREAFQGGNQALGAAFARLEADDWDRPTAHRTGSVRRLVQTRLNELAVHGWDIQSVLEPPGHLRDASLPVLLDLIGRWFELLFTPDPAQTRPWRVRFDYLSREIASRDLVIGASTVSFEPTSGEAADLVLHTHPEVTILLAMGRIDPARAVQTYGLTTSGRAELLGPLRSRFELI
jgi:uncharacterized protein (TIGR03083 family)